MPKGLNPIQKLLNRRTGHLQRLAHQAHHHQLLLEHVREQLPIALRDHCLGACLQGVDLVLFTDSASWATRLRFALPALQSALDQPTARVRVLPPHAARPTHPSNPATLSQASASLLRDTAQSIQDQRLRVALERLAQRADADPND